MKLSDLYTTGTVAKSVGSIAPVCTRTIDEMYPETGMDFDTSILLCNGSTSEMLNKGAYGSNFTAYTANGSLQNGETTSPINFLGCVIIRDFDGDNPLNLTRKIISEGDIYGATWADVKNLRFVTNVVSSESISGSKYQSFDITTTSNIIYDFNSTYVEPNFRYSKQNTFLTQTGFVNNPLSLTGDDSKRIFGAEFNVNASTYNKYMGDSNNINKEKIGNLGFIYLINNEYFLLKSPISMPDSGYDHKSFTIDNIKNYLTIGGFSDFENGNTGFLPQNDETKGAYPYTQTASGSYKQSCNYYITSNCAIYTLNSCGLRWVLTSNVTTAKNFRDSVKLGKMNSDGIISHKEWIDGESAIQASDNPNKDTSYDNIPDRPTPGGDDDIDDIALTMSTVNNAAFRRLFALNSTELNQLEAALSGNYLEPLPSGFDPLQSVISLSVFPWDITNVNWIGCNTTAGAEITISGWNSGVTGNYITGATSAFIELGSFNVEHRHNNFLDYAPYTTVSVYVPYCGEIELPTNLVMGQSVRVFLIYDIPSGSCRAVIKSSNGAILGTIAGNFSSEIEVTSSEAGLKKQSIISTSLNTTGQVVSTAIGVVKEDISAATGGIVGSLGAVSQSIASMNKNYTSSVGTTDGMVNFFMPDQCYIKITRPKVSIPSNYGHTTGYACNKTMKLGELIPGNYYVANNPDLSNSLGNEEEKTMLKAALENGFFK